MKTWFLTHRWPLGLALLLLLVLAAAGTRNPYYVRLAIQYGCIYAIVIAGLNVLTGGSGQVSLGQVGLYAIGALAGALLARLGSPWVVGALMAVVAATVGGAVIAAPALRLRGAYLALSTLAFALIVLDVLDALPRLLGQQGSFAVQGSLPLLRPSDLDMYLLFCLLLAAPVVAVSRNWFWSATGRQLQAVKDDEAAARSLGIAVFPAKLWAFLFSAACAGLAGAMLVRLTGSFGAGDFTEAESLRFVIALLIGGLAAPVAGPVWGAAAMTVLTYVGQVYFQERQVMLTALVLLAILAFAPSGIGGGLRRLGRRLGLAWLQPGQALVEAATIRAEQRRAAEKVESLPAAPPARKLPGGSVVWAAPGKMSTAVIDHPAGPILVETPPLLDVVGIAKSFGGVRAVDQVTFTVQTGSIHVLMGPNGSGKSTCLDLVSGLQRLDRGRVRLLGEDVSDLPAYTRARRGVARTFQEIQLFRSLTVLENCMVGSPSERRAWRQLLREPSVAREELEHADAALALLDECGLAGFAGRQAAELSYGQRKMLELARAASRRPKLLLADEPSAGLNPRWVESMVVALDELRRAGYTLLVVEHHQDVIADIADQVTVLDQGRVIAEGAAADVQRDPDVMRVYLGSEK